MRIEGRTGVARYADDQEGPPRYGNQGETLVSDMNGFFYEQAMRGNAFVYSTALAGNALVAATTTNAPFLWNPLGSGKNIVLIKIAAGRTAKGTPLEGNIVYLTLANAGAAVGTGAPIVSGTFVAGVNCLLGGGQASIAKFAPTTVATTGTPTIIGPAGFAQTADNGATTVSGPHSESLIDYINGLIIIPPGNTFQIGASVALSSTYAFSIWALELPVPLIA